MYLRLVVLSPVLKQWGLFRDGLNAVARSNVAPEIAPPAEPTFYAFCYTVPASKASPAFVAAGIQQGGIGLHPVYFNHNALYHLVQGIALALIFLAARGLLREPPFASR
jgi:hypothetical protein